ncbi:MAG TPA: aspartyl protease family protein [Pyrinomonadaceae bacterium]|jgi:predicted aspartyl protease
MCIFIRACARIIVHRLLPVALIISLVALSVTTAYGTCPAEEGSTVPFDGTNDLIIVNVLLDGKGPFRLLLDSGATGHSMTPELAQALGLKIQGTGVIDVGSKEMVGAGIVRIAKLEIGGISLSDQIFFVAAYPPSYPFQGFLGADIFKRFVIRADFKRMTITLTSPENFRYQGTGTVVPLKLYKGGFPQVRGEVDGQKGWFKLDTGYNGSLALFGKFIDKHKLLKKYAPVMSEQGGRTLAGEVGASPVARINVLRVGALEMRDITASLFLEKGNSNDAFAGAIGTRLFKQFNVIFNYNKQQVIFEKR